MNSVKEGRAAWLDVTFRNRSNQPEAPTSATYKITCMTTGTVIVPEAAISPVSSAVTITISSEQNRIINQGNARERRLVTVVAAYGVGDALPDEMEYEVVNLAGVG